MERPDAEHIAAVLQGDAASFEPLVQKYSPRVFATARRYARRESEVEDIVQEVWLKAFHKLASFRGDAPFEHVGRNSCLARRSQRFDDPALPYCAAVALTDDAVEFPPQGHEVGDLAIDVCKVLARDGVHCLAGALFTF